MKKTHAIRTIMFALFAAILVACGGTETIVEVTKIVEVEKEVIKEVEVEKIVEVEVEGEMVEVVVTEIVEVVVEPTDVPDPQGGTMIESSFADAAILNPILASGSPDSDINTKMFLGLVTTDAFTGETIGEIANGWDVSDDGLTYTFTLNEDIAWTDGTPMTAQDFKFTYDAIASENVETPRKSNVELISNIDVVDDYTVSVEFSEVDCTALPNLGLGILPAHMYADDFSDIMENDLNDAPTVTSGPFKFEERQPDAFTRLARNDDFYLGAPNVDAWTYQIFADQSAELEATLAGEVDITGVGPQFVSVIEAEIASGGDLAMKKFFDDGYTYIGFNMADPANPEPGWDDVNENGEYDEGEGPNLDQAAHPVFGDPEVRRAVSQAIDYTNIINKVVFGQGVQATVNVLPAIEWAFNNDVTPYQYDLDAAAATLEEAGWVAATEGGVRSKDGQELSFTLMTNAGNEVRENIAAIAKDTLDGIGFNVELEIIEFGTVVEKLLGQTFDAVIIGWTGLGSDPEDSSLFAYRNDAPGSGFNFVSYYNETVEENLSTARSLPGCDSGERGALYKEIQQAMHEDAPYAFLYVPLGNVVWNSRLQNVDPGPWLTYWNVEDWYIAP